MKRIELSGIFTGDSRPDPFMGIRSGQVEVGRPKIQSEIISIRIQFSNRSTSTWPDFIPKKGSNSYARKLNFTREKILSISFIIITPRHVLPPRLYCVSQMKPPAAGKPEWTSRCPLQPGCDFQHFSEITHIRTTWVQDKTYLLFAIIAEETPIPEKRQHF